MQELAGSTGGDMQAIVARFKTLLTTLANAWKAGYESSSRDKKIKKRRKKRILGK